MARGQKVITDKVSPRQIVDNALEGANDIAVAISPLVWQPSDGTAAKQWYFSIATSEPERGFRVDCVYVDAETREAERQRVIMELIQRKPIVLHTFDDELDMARWCEALWPGERITEVRKSIERERAQWSAKKTA